MANEDDNTMKNSVSAAREFSPAAVDTTRTNEEDYRKALHEPMDRRDGAVYVYSDAARNAVKVALATGRPLLVFGDPGSGKSSLASCVARYLGFRYYETLVTSRTQARDLMWTFDAVARLADAEAGLVEQTADRYRYIEPAALWWAFDPKSASRRGGTEVLLSDPGRIFPGSPGDQSDRAVVLIDEIDKADPDVPNDLLVPLGALTFRVKEIELQVDGNRNAAPLIIITTNEERDLPSAFLRRCVQVRLPIPQDADYLVRIADAHFGDVHNAVYRDVADAFQRIRTNKENRGQRPVSTAEYLDAVRACLLIEGARPPDGPMWTAVRETLLAKRASERTK